eukprot:c10234_g1_i2.p1 GENE.c10234_g1_i2~~c10234_g1_i2.p1  ORF type:complete len:151 (-),score=2.34 c10234_g1_i2:59-511(-)
MLLLWTKLYLQGEEQPTCSSHASHIQMGSRRNGPKERSEVTLAKMARLAPEGSLIVCDSYFGSVHGAEAIVELGQEFLSRAAKTGQHGCFLNIFAQVLRMARQPLHMDAFEAFHSLPQQLDTIFFCLHAVLSIFCDTAYNNCGATGSRRH